MKKTILTETRFSNLELSDSIIKGLKEAGFIQCSPIQDRALPIALRDRDVAGQAQTGTGKTATFLLATFQRLINDESEKIKNPRALILAPTRELAIQIHKDALALSRYLNLKFALIYGGTDYQKQLDKLKTDVDIIIGTPGRIIDFYRQGAFTLDNIQVSVMDEADRMFDLGFIKDIRFLLRRMPPPEKRLNLLFSATLSYKVTELAYEHMNNPVMVKIETEEVTSKAINQFAFCPANDQKIPLLLGLLKTHQPVRSIVFVNTKRCAEQLDDYLQANGHKVAMLSGDVPQEKRQRLLNDFQENRVTLLIATDVAARGLHIPDVSHVFNYDLPQDVEDYVHRIGRTARFGASGEAISFICEEYAYSMPDIEDYIGEKVPVRAIDQELLIEDVIKPERREPRERVPAHGKRPPRGDKPERDRRPPRPHREHGQPATTAPASAPENLPQPETP
ncbi:DEAD/DEAH box helicase [Methylomonas sp. MED-D]|uniref:ATP-dependent RNA helicase RhlB n=2 Tax=Methylomonas TaxID=416 RepID=A0A177P2I3_9GAMM|nr:MULTISPECIES: DEAD/DEAH box helicase [Methylomonas]MDT4330650.1 DEAD/DEAH box helicase [Methylomonas sp. MV1]OAI24455.1 RNA helicase [Methylomonas koyamae]WGS86221.1 DEAD/DEAH box helicase [Methylomonas sp. UP202]